MGGHPSINEQILELRGELRNATFVIRDPERSTEGTMMRVAEVKAITFPNGRPVYSVRCTNGELYDVRVRVEVIDSETSTGDPVSYAVGYEIVPLGLSSGRPGRAGPQEKA